MKKLFLFVFMILLQGCDADLDFDMPEIVSVSPRHNEISVSGNTRITVNFSKEMDTVKTNTEFSLSGGSGNVEGRFTWENDGKKLVFTPLKTLTGTDKFTIKITRGAEDRNGNDLKQELISDFYLGDDSVAPFLISYSPGANTIGCGRDTVVTLIFSEPLDLNSIYSGIVISPAPSGYFSWNTAHTEIYFTPLYGFDYRTTYTVSVKSEICDSDGNSLRETVSFNFTVGDDFTAPGLSVYQELAVPLNFDEGSVTHGAEKRSRIAIRFTEQIDMETLRGAFSITPSVNFYISSEYYAGATRAWINFTEDMMSSEVYTLRINSDITDLQGNPLSRNYRYVFVTDGADSTPPEVVAAGDMNGASSAYEPWIIGDIQPLAIIPPDIYPGIVVDFSKQINPPSLTLSIETVAGSGGYASILDIDWPDSPPALKFTRLKFGLAGVLSGNIYRLTIKGGSSGLCDMKGNHMKEDFVQMIRF